MLPLPAPPGQEHRFSYLIRRAGSTPIFPGAGPRSFDAEGVHRIRKQVGSDSPAGSKAASSPNPSVPQEGGRQKAAFLDLETLLNRELGVNNGS